MTRNFLVVIGTRPNFIKVTRFKKIAAGYPDVDLKIVHTGQHFDNNMADVFFEQFNLAPDFFLNISQSSANTQIAEIMLKLEELVQTKFKPDLILVVGDVNSTLAAALAADKLKIPLAHIESGLRSFDRSMPEEFNRIVTDQLANYLFITEPSGEENLRKEKISEGKMHMVGNTMIDTLVEFSPQIERSNILDQLAVDPQKFVLCTIHRPATVDSEEGLNKLISLLETITKKYKAVFPIHPRTVNNLKKFGLYEKLIGNKSLVTTLPLDYFAFQKLIKYCRFIVTDSGGIQEESTFLQVPCLTLRNNTERPVTCTMGTNTLVPFEISEIEKYILRIENGTYKKGQIPHLWDGQATERIFAVLAKS
ncbi:MAG TPA: UDP-N-acetylglucosamine 2-epimerase (non-hydrolyzing) [Bacteroidia bacterium]|nr:UDP-N-acetylglucosamine 2-epimerase (non-hydrolyzing) [Bacteroidia bacterium]